MKPSTLPGAALFMIFYAVFAHETAANEGPSPAAGSAAHAEVVKLPAPSEKIQTLPLFEKLSPDRTGVDFTVTMDEDIPMRHLFGASGFAMGGVVMGDFDGDGLPDLYMVSGPGKNRLYRQTEEFRFVDITEQARVDGGDAWGTGATVVDIDNDGDLDIYVCNYDAPNMLFVNEGNGMFSESAERFGLNIQDATLMAAFSDYDRDGHLDVYLLMNRYYASKKYPYSKMGEFVDGQLQIIPELRKFYTLQKGPDGNYTVVVLSRHDRLLRNNGDGTFSDVSAQAGIQGAGRGLSATWWDYNQDNYPDLYVGNDFIDADRLYRNNGDGTFSNVIVDTIPHTSWFSMGADAADINNDGLMDFLTTDMAATTHFKAKVNMGEMSAESRWFLENAMPRQYMRNALYLNTGTHRFMEIAALAGVVSTDWTWAVNFADLDNDGRVDLLINNGMTRNFMDSDLTGSLDSGELQTKTEWELFADEPPLLEQNLGFRNLGDLRFKDVSKSWGVDHVGMSYGSAIGDLDRDGDLDLVIANMNEPVSIYRNRGTAAHRVQVQLKGRSSNRFGVGAAVRLQSDSGIHVRYMTTIKGYLSAREPMVHFGLGSDEQVNTLSISWPSGHEQVFTNLSADRLYVISEPDGDPAPRPIPESDATMFKQVDYAGQVRHQETPFNDYKRQPLLPYKHSQLGPGIAFGDVNGDGREDFYLGGAAGSVGALCLNEEGGELRFQPADTFDSESQHEDMGVLLFEADGDGDLDLYIVSGSVECEPQDPALQDRLYLNDGQGVFTRAPEGSLPEWMESGSVVTAADYDRDGDLDLFVGGRVIPGKYPLTPVSKLLENQKGVFKDVTTAHAPELSNSGLVTSALWSDADGDGWIDLLVAHEWGPIKLYKNKQGKLVDETAEAGLDQFFGWWNGIAARDLDGDEDLDLVVCNLGLNTKYKAKRNKPALLYYGDFDGSGSMRLLEAKYESDTLYPVRGKSCSTAAMPFLANRFGTFRDFAKSSLDQIYTPECVSEARRWEANIFESGVLINDGSGKFQFHALPRITQAAPGYGVVLTEVDGDGNADAYIVQNFFSPEPETGRMDGGLSLLLLGRGDGTFDPVEPAKSGLIIPWDAKGLAASDFNGDGAVDFAVAINDAEPMLFENVTDPSGQSVTVSLRGRPGNPTAVGARITAVLSDGSTQTAEVHAGSGYLSQSSPRIVFGIRKGQHLSSVVVNWPDGSRTQHPITQEQRSIIIDQPTD
jgi:hypothetical protein